MVCVWGLLIVSSSILRGHQVPNPDSNPDHSPHGRGGGLTSGLNPDCPRVYTANVNIHITRHNLPRLKVKVHLTYTHT